MGRAPLVLLCCGFGCLMPNPKHGADGTTEASEATTSGGAMPAGTGGTSVVDTGAPTTGDKTSGVATAGSAESGPGGPTGPGLTDVPAVEACDPWTQTSCGRGQRCKPYSIGVDRWSLVCMPLLRGALRVWGDCTPVTSKDEIDECGPGLACIEGVCTPICIGEPNAPLCPLLGTECRVVDDGAFGLCNVECDPLSDECEPGQACYLVAGEAGALQGFACLEDASGGFGAFLDPCEEVNECQPGSTCIEAPDWLMGCGAPRCCTPICNADEATPCPVPTTCTVIHSPAPPGFDQIGVCVD